MSRISSASRAALLLASLVLAACDGPTGADRRLVLESDAPAGPQREGTGLAFAVRAKDASGRPAPGVTVAFRMVEGSGTLAVAASVTDSAGMAGSTLQLGPGRNVAEAWVDGRAEPVRLVVDAARRRWVEFPADSLVLVGPTCASPVMLARGADDADRYALSVAPQEPVVGVRTHSASLTRPNRFSLLVSGIAVGETRIVASLDVPPDAAKGWATADTMLVRVLPSAPKHISTLADTLWLQPDGARNPIGGSKSFLAALVKGQCGEEMRGEKITYSTSDPAVAEVDSAGAVTSRAAGRATLHLRSGALSKDVQVLVRRVVLHPADTTVFVGDTVRYRVLHEDETGRLVESRGATYTSFGGYYTMSADGLLTATRSTLSGSETSLAPAPEDSWLVRAILGPTGWSGWIVDARIRIRPRP